MSSKLRFIVPRRLFPSSWIGVNAGPLLAQTVQPHRELLQRVLRTKAATLDALPTALSAWRTIPRSCGCSDRPGAGRTPRPLGAGGDGGHSIAPASTHGRGRTWDSAPVRPLTTPSASCVPLVLKRGRVTVQVPTAWQGILRSLISASETSSHDWLSPLRCTVGSWIASCILLAALAGSSKCIRERLALDGHELRVVAVGVQGDLQDAVRGGLAH